MQPLVPILAQPLRSSALPLSSRRKPGPTFQHLVSGPVGPGLRRDGIGPRAPLSALQRAAGQVMRLENWTVVARAR